MIDWTRVSTLRDQVGTDDFDKVVEVFLKEVERVICRLKRANEVSDCKDLDFLKGSAFSLGFQEFCSLCEKGEDLCNKGMKATIDLSEISICFESSKKCFLAELADLIKD
tara:strand:- start:292 stop:621 length:330 start_codon:yes stop_codon:yes gene_type:complete